MKALLCLARPCLEMAGFVLGDIFAPCAVSVFLVNKRGRKVEVKVIPEMYFSDLFLTFAFAWLEFSRAFTEL